MLCREGISMRHTLPAASAGAFLLIAPLRHKGRCSSSATRCSARKYPTLSRVQLTAPFDSTRWYSPPARCCDRRTPRRSVPRRRRGLVRVGVHGSSRKAVPPLLPFAKLRETTMRETCQEPSTSCSWSHNLLPRGNAVGERPGGRAMCSGRGQRGSSRSGTVDDGMIQPPTCSGPSLQRPRFGAYTQRPRFDLGRRVRGRSCWATRTPACPGPLGRRMARRHRASSFT